MTADVKKMIIGGVFSLAKSGESFPVVAPADGRVIASVALANAADADDAVEQARHGFQLWAALAPGERERILLRAAEIIEAEGESRFLDNLIDEGGCTIGKARGEIGYSADLLRTAAGESRRLYGDTFPNDNPERISMVFREPLGVVAVISPYNAPLALLTKMSAFPLAAGNAIVIKPSEETPLTALAFGQLMLDAGLPPACISVITGMGAQCGAALSANPSVDCIALTGSSATGRLVGAESMQHMRRCQLELGGKSALLVLRDADPVKAAAIAAQGIFNHAGQICMANSRVVVDRAIYQPFVAALKAASEAIVYGDLRDEKSQFGPLINQQAVDKVLSHVRDAVAGGAELLTGGNADGLIVEPTVLLEPARDTTVWCEESFGPVVSVVAADGLEDAIAIANDSQYGLSAAVLTHNVQWGFRAARGIKAGSVHIGMHAFQSNAMAPIGGYKMSGIGRSGGKYSTEEFTELKWVSVSLEDDGADG